MKGIIKANTADKYLRPIRQQIVELVEPNTTLVEVGCGNGDLLFRLSPKLKLGVGIDKSEQLINYALDRSKERHFENLEFRIADIIKEPFWEPVMEYSVASLILHVLPWNKSIEVIEKLLVASNTIIICGFTKPKNVKQSVLLWLDQRFTRHYSNFIDFQKYGYTEGILKSIPDIKIIRIDTFDPVIKIFIVTKCSNAINA